MRIELIQLAVATYYGYTVKQLLGKGRKRHLAFARQAAMWIAEELTGLSCVELGEYFNRDQSTVNYSLRKFEEYLDTELVQMTKQGAKVMHLYDILSKQKHKEKDCILRNSIICKNCGEEVHSKAKDDLQICACKSVSVDGGYDQLKRTCAAIDAVTDTSIRVRIR